MKKSLFILFTLFLGACEPAPVAIRPQTDGSTDIVNDGQGSAKLYIVEKDGYKFAVLVGGQKAGICQIIEPVKQP